MSARHSTDVPQLKAVLVGIDLPRVPYDETTASIRELGRLVETLGYNVIGSLRQKRNSTSSAVVIGDGKLRELAQWTGGPGKIMPKVEVKKSKAAERFGKSADADDELEDGDDSDDEAGDWDRNDSDDTSIGEDGDEDLTDTSGGTASSVAAPTERADVVVFDCELTPSQLRNLESATAAKVLDRTGVIIEIFSRHARTRAARLQVEIARLNYLAPRIRETGGGEDRQGGGIGGKGAGETSYELDRRRIRDRVKELRRELETVQDEHAVRRARRSGENCVALVGYTNAGKSSLMRAMTGSEIYVADKLFATLDTTVRPLYPESMPKILLSDTVGFIKKLPHDLVASFRSTLDEALNADLLLFVVDSSDPTFRSQLQVTQDVLREIGVVDTPSRLVLNKRDCLTADEEAALRTEFPDAIVLSTRDPQDLKKMREGLIAFFERDMVEEMVFVPYMVQGAIGEIRGQMRVLEENFDEQGVRLRVRAQAEQLRRFRAKWSL